MGACAHALRLDDSSRRQRQYYERLRAGDMLLMRESDISPLSPRFFVGRDTMIPVVDGIVCSCPAVEAVAIGCTENAVTASNRENSFGRSNLTEWFGKGCRKRSTSAICLCLHEPVWAKTNFIT